MIKKPEDGPKGLSSVPAGPDSSEGLDAEERRRRLRLSLSSEQFKLAATGKIFSVLDLSLEGMALRIIDPEDFVLLTVGAHIEGSLNLAAQKVWVSAQVRHLASQVVGCQFDSLSAEARHDLEQFLAPAAMGLAMRLMPSMDGSSLWYHGASGTDLLLTGQTKMTLYARGAYVQWEAGQGLTTGLTESAELAPPGHGEGWGVVRFETTLMRPDPAPDTQKLLIAKALILGSKLPEELKNWCLGQLDHPLDKKS